MNTKNLLTMTAFALGTATLTVATFLTGPLDAGMEMEPLAATIAAPKLVAHGVELSVTAAGGRHFKAGDQAAFDLKAANTLDKPTNMTVRVTMLASALANVLSRAMPVPVQIWQDERLLTFQPNELKTVTLVASAPLPTNSMVSITLKEVDPLKDRTATGEGMPQPAPGFVPKPGAGIVVLSFSTAAPQAPPAFAAAE